MVVLQPRVAARAQEEAWLTIAQYYHPDDQHSGYNDIVIMIIILALAHSLCCQQGSIAFAHFGVHDILFFRPASNVAWMSC